MSNKRFEDLAHDYEIDGNLNAAATGELIAIIRSQELRWERLRALAEGTGASVPIDDYTRGWRDGFREVGNEMKKIEAL